MNPISSSYNSQHASRGISSNEVIWDGPDVECLNLCTGELITDTMYKVASKLCEFIKEFDLSTFDLKCLIDACDSCPDPEKNVVNVLKLLRDGYCELKQKVDELGGTSTDNTSFLDVNLKCLAVVDGAGEILNNNSEKQIIQTVIDRVCVHDSEIALINTKISNLEQQIENIDLTPTVELPQVSAACIHTGTRALDDSYEALAADYCDFKEVVGDASAINQALSQFVAIPELQSNPAFQSVVNSMARGLNNLILGYLNLRQRVRAIEAGCCAPSCDKITIGFLPVFDFDNRLLDMQFTAGAGTNIPLGFVDCGTTITITDKNGLRVQIITDEDTAIANNSTISDINIGSLAFGTLNVNFDTKFCLYDSDNQLILTCSKCHSQNIEYTGGCCTIKNEGTSEVTIIYQTC